MNNIRATRSRDTARSFLRIIRGVTEASLVAVAFAFAILLIGTPAALIIRGLHEALSWAVRSAGATSVLADALVSVSSGAGGLMIAGVLVRLLVRTFRRPRTTRASVIGGEAPRTRAVRRALETAA
jgi:hypothetical protein